MIALTQALPMRTNAVWGQFADPEVIPRRYGMVTGKLIPYDENRTVFVWADHASEGIDEVTIDGVTTADWSWTNGVDSSGHAVTFVNFGQPQDSGADLSASGRGILHPRTGSRMDNPATVVWDILANLCGRSVTEGALAGFARECAAANLIAAGSIEAAGKVGAAVREICDSFGALFSLDMTGLCRLVPATGAYAALTVDARYDLSATAKGDDLYNDLTLNFDFAEGAARQSIQVEAADSVRRAGRSTTSFDAKWIGDGRVAFEVASRMLAGKARPNWTLSVGNVQSDIRIGDFADIDNTYSPVAGRWMVTGRELDLDADTASLTILAYAGNSPAIRLVRQSSAFDPRQYSSVGVDTVGSERILTLLEADSSPIVNAQVTLDGVLQRYTDGSGRVSFPVSAMPVGYHQLAILTQDGRPLTITVLVQ